MRAADNIKNTAQDLNGKAKEAAGEVTDNEELQAQGKSDQTKTEAKASKYDKGVFNN